MPRRVPMQSDDRSHMSCGRRSLPLCFGLIVLICGGCATDHNARAAAFLRPYEQSEWSRAAAAVTREAQRSVGDPDELLWRLEQGTVLRTSGDVTGSDAAFAQADELLERIESQPALSLSEQAAALLTNPRAIRYRGYAYDRVMLSVYRALNSLEAGDSQAARVHLNRAHDRQADAVAHNAERIAALREQYARDSRYDLQRTLDNPHVTLALSEQYDELRQYRAYADYVNPFAEWLAGLYFTVAGVGGSDLERGRLHLSRAAGMVTLDNHHVQADLAMAEAVIAGEPMEPTVWVVFETGRAPSRRSVRIDIPLFIFGGQVDYVGVAFPALTFHSDHASVLQVTAGGETHRTLLVASMDRVVAQEFENALPAEIARTVLSAAAKAAAAYGIQRATRNEDWLNVVTRIGATLYQAAMNEADTRTWLSLPKQWQVCRLPRPADGVIQVSMPRADQAVAVELLAGEAVLVWVRGVGPYTRPAVRQMRIE